MYSYRITPKAEREIASAQSYLERQRDGLGDELLDDIEATLLVIRQSPHTFARLTQRTRKLRCGRFAYFIYYCVNKEVVVVTSFFHTRRDRRAR